MEYYNKKLKKIGTIELIVLDTILVFALIAAIFLFITDGFSWLNLALLVIVVVFGLFLNYQILKRCFVKIIVDEDEFKLVDFFKSSLVIKKENMVNVYLEEMENNPIYICIETNDDIFPKDAPFKIKYQEDYANAIKKAYK